MANDRISKLRQASFRGIAFFVESESKRFGKKNATHDYPFTDFRDIDELGIIPPIFKLEAYLSGENWMDDYAELERALVEDGPGRLVLPVFGAFNVIASPFDASAAVVSVGEIKLSLEFSVVRANATTKEKWTAEKVYDSGDTARQSINDSIASLWNAPKSALSKTFAVNDILATASMAAMGLSSMISEPYSAINNVARLIGDVRTAISSASAVANIVSGTWDNYSQSDYSSFGASTFRSTSNPGKYGEYDSSSQFSSGNGAGLEHVSGCHIWPETTADRKIRSNNRIVIYESYQANVYIIMLEQAAVAEYKTTDDINKTIEIIGEMSRNVSKSTTLNQSVMSNIATVKEGALSLINNKKQKSYRVSNATLRSARSARLIAYQLNAERYKESSEIDDAAKLIVGLNTGKPPHNIAGEVKVTN